MPPNRKPLWNAAAERPRWSGAATRSSRLYAPTVNIAEPAPPAPRSTSSWPYDAESPASRLETATIPMPVASTIRSPNRSTMRPATGANTSRMTANAATTENAAVLSTPNCLANRLIAGATIPNPRATENATAVRTATSGGRSRSGLRSRLVIARHAPRRAPGWSATPATQSEEVVHDVLAQPLGVGGEHPAAVAPRDVLDEL